MAKNDLENIKSKIKKEFRDLEKKKKEEKKLEIKLATSIYTLIKLDTKKKDIAEIVEHLGMDRRKFYRYFYWFETGRILSKQKHEVFLTQINSEIPEELKHLKENISDIIYGKCHKYASDNGLEPLQVEVFLRGFYDFSVKLALEQHSINDENLSSEMKNKYLTRKHLEHFDDYLESLEL